MADSLSEAEQLTGPILVMQQAFAGMALFLEAAGSHDPGAPKDGALGAAAAASLLLRSPLRPVSDAANMVATDIGLLLSDEEADVRLRPAVLWYEKHTPPEPRLRDLRLRDELGALASR